MRLRVTTWNNRSYFLRRDSEIPYVVVKSLEEKELEVFTNPVGKGKKISVHVSFLGSLTPRAAATLRDRYVILKWKAVAMMRAEADDDANAAKRRQLPPAEKSGFVTNRA
ncbi:hypothetical protein MRX96_007549 [Rhipicephalus microplus]